MNTAPSCYFDYINNPISPYRKILFRKIFSSVDGGDVLDLGCGQTGHYWALGYAHRAGSISFYDYSKKNIHALEASLNALNPEVVNDRFSGTIEFLRNEKIIPHEIPIDGLVSDVIRKTHEIRQFDFLTDTTVRRFDHIVAVESLECVNTEKDFTVAITNALGLLKPAGHLAIVILRYDRVTKDTRKLIEDRLEGSLNPDADMLKRVLSKLGHDKFTIETIRGIEIPNYPEAIVVHVYNP